MLALLVMVDIANLYYTLMPSIGVVFRYRVLY